MKQLLLLLVLKMIINAKAEGGDMTECQELFRRMENENATKYREECIDKFNLPVTVGDRTDEANPKTGRRNEMAFIFDYLKLNSQQKRMLTTCVYSKQGFLKDGEQFSAKAVKGQVTEALWRIKKSPQRDAVTTAISNDACPLQDGEPNLLDVVKFMLCLRESCATAATPSPDVELIPV
ncbi:uncharacterized protein LOC122253133 [Penaeus japonicus]|uniref:uncharacterized protein LOC122253133 n=1 Tax=Penaeus japonicus TaxID=27405 RepID=UPI001C70DCEF|nr:uncharacterized protein LOC122253133 [Penaeus japonicus]